MNTEQLPLTIAIDDTEDLVIKVNGVVHVVWEIKPLPWQVAAYCRWLRDHHKGQEQ
jgi:hypothetical protein